MIEKPCDACSGRGFVRRSKRVKVTIPAGIEHGKRVSIPGMGDDGANGGPAGDLYIYVHVRPHAHFERDGNDVYCVIPVSISQATLGTEITVDTMDEKKIKVKVPPSTQNGKILRLRSEGIPFLNSPHRRGDMYIRILVKIPQRLTGKARELLRQFAKIQGEETNPSPVPLSEL